MPLEAIPQKPMGFVAAMKDAFGFAKKADGTTQTLTEFSAEVKALSPADQEYFKKHLAAAGYQLQ